MASKTLSFGVKPAQEIAISAPPLNNGGSAPVDTNRDLGIAMQVPVTNPPVVNSPLLPPTRGVAPVMVSSAIEGFDDDEYGLPIKVVQKPTAKRSMIHLRNRVGAVINRIGLEDEKFTVLGNDCWGHALYEGYGLPYQTPLLGAGLFGDCFIRFAGDLEGYLKSPLRFSADTRYPGLRRLRAQRGGWPIGLLKDDVEIHFLHFRSQDACRRVWEKGCETMRMDRIALKLSTDKDGVTQEHIERFAAMPFERKLIISPRHHPNIPCAIQVPDYLTNGAMMFRRSIKYFDCTHWLNTGEVKRGSPRVWIDRLIYSKGA
jgi:uncharacterized protein (DUF1919 family)